MSRKVGTRDKPKLYSKILDLLEKHQEGLNAYAIHKALKANDKTVRTYLMDLKAQGKVSSVQKTKRIVLWGVLS
jgi:DNA-binding IclR family transcriptional regulator